MTLVVRFYKPIPVPHCHRHMRWIKNPKRNCMWMFIAFRYLFVVYECACAFIINSHKKYTCMKPFDRFLTIMYGCANVAMWHTLKDLRFLLKLWFSWQICLMCLIFLPNWKEIVDTKWSPILVLSMVLVA